MPNEDDQSYYWTEGWQEGEREARAEIEAGLARTFATADELIAYLGESAEALKVLDAKQLVGIRILERLPDEDTDALPE